MSPTLLEKGGNFVPKVPGWQQRIESALLSEQALYVCEFLFLFGIYSISSHFATLLIITQISFTLLQLRFKSRALS